MCSYVGGVLDGAEESHQVYPQAADAAASRPEVTSDAVLRTAGTAALAAVIDLSLRAGPQHHDPAAPVLTD